ncbi:hypothetical protein BT67DRAFT_443421 [Trichocladium antarcticum]|uniref:Uncharacterized protein n=1 Tax=Trichocladium antarcticum TaxID=1450529 RepID=A0AAN6ZCB8_9PEZI|nr:hypothetical protein BT67DRAFT_443421 [Trichocladium antarcticum]
MSRVFLMKWYHFSVEYFEDLRNVNHCEFLTMRRNDESGKYLLENKLRTWSELKRERALEDKGKAGDAQDWPGENGTTKDATTLARNATFVVRRRWGGCPNGCNHDKNFRIHKALADLVKSDIIVSKRTVGLATAEANSSASGGSSGAATVTTCTPTSSSPAPGPALANPSFNGTANSTSQACLASRRPAAKRFQAQTTHDKTDNDDGGNNSDDRLPELVIPHRRGGSGGPQIDVTRARDEIVSSPDGTPSFISVDDRLRSRLKSPNVGPPLPHHQQKTQLHVGRDFGGTYSGHTSGVSDGPESETSESSEEDEGGKEGSGVNGGVNATLSGNGSTLKPLHPSSPARPHWQRGQSRMCRGARANRLGDHHSSDGDHEADGEHEPAEPDEESGEELMPPQHIADVADEMADEADEVLASADRDERGFEKSVY